LLVLICQSASTSMKVVEVNSQHESLLQARARRTLPALPQSPAMQRRTLAPLEEFAGYRRTFGCMKLPAAWPGLRGSDDRDVKVCAGTAFQQRIAALPAAKPVRFWSCRGRRLSTAKPSKHWIKMRLQRAKMFGNPTCGVPERFRWCIRGSRKRREKQCPFRD
jgi:hypothetical protein